MRFIIMLMLAMASAITLRAIPADLKSALDTLDWHVANHAKFMANQQSRADSLKQRAIVADNDRQLLDLYTRIGEVYRGCDVDSAQFYIDKGIDLADRMGDKHASWRLKASYSSLLPVSGIIKEALDIYNSIPVDSLHPAEKAHYYEEGNRLYNYALGFYANREYINVYYDRVIALTDSLLNYLDPKSLEYKLYKGEQDFFMGNNAMALADLNDLISQISIDNNLYARAASMIGYYYTLKEDEDTALYYYTLSAISDLASGTREYTSLQYVGEKMHERGDIDRAYKYLTLSLDDATGSGSFIRTIESAQTIPMIYDSIAKRNYNIINWLVVVLIIMLGVIFAAILYIMKLKKREISAERLSGESLKARMAQEDFSAHLLDIAADEIAKIEESNRLLSRKLRAKAYVDAYDYTSSAKSLTEAREIFAEKFDAAFKAVHPNFLENLNKLLLPDKQMAVTETFSPEQRIMALVASGVTETRDIALLLGLSVNTVYTYRNKVRGRAINREEFEKALKSI